jgi:hypothetical protein
VKLIIDDNDDFEDWNAEQERAESFAVSIGCTIIHDEITCHTIEQWDMLLAFRLREDRIS